jgi:hypothetical protein
LTGFVDMGPGNDRLIVGRDSLVIASSYSGNTEESLSSFEEAQRRGARVLVLTTGGKIAELARAAKEAGVERAQSQALVDDAVGHEQYRREQNQKWYESREGRRWRDDE